VFQYIGRRSSYRPQFQACTAHGFATAAPPDRDRQGSSSRRGWLYFLHNNCGDSGGGVGGTARQFKRGKFLAAAVAKTSAEE